MLREYEVGQVKYVIQEKYKFYVVPVHAKKLNKRRSPKFDLIKFVYGTKQGFY